MKKDEIVRKIDEVRYGVSVANSFVIAYESIMDAKKQTPDEYNYSRSFFAIARHSLQQSIFLETAKLLEDSKDVYSVKSFFEVYQEYLCRAKKKVKRGTAMSDFFDNRFSSSCIQFNIQQIAKMESELCNWRSAFDNCIKDVEGDCDNENLCIYCLRINLKTQRDKFIAHRDRKYLYSRHKLFEDYPISTKGVEKLLKYAHTILNSIKSNLTGIDTDPTPYHSYGLGNIFQKLRGLKYDVCGNSISDEVRELQTKCLRQKVADLSVRRE